MTPPDDPAIGARLRSGREQLGLSVIQASERLHLDPKVIEALEAERFEELGAPVYVRGHMRRYAELIGESPQALQEHYIARLSSALQPDLRLIPTQLPPVAKRLTWPFVVIAVLLVVGAVVWWALTRPHTVSAPPAEPAAAASPAPQQATPQAAASPAAAAPASTATAGAAAGGRAQLRLDFREDSWTEIYDADGQRLFYDVGASGTQHAVSGTAPLRVTIANPGGVRLQLNGKAIKAPSTAEFMLAGDGRILPGE